MKIALIGYEANVKERVGSNEYAFSLLVNLEKLDRKNQYFIYLPQEPLADLPKQRPGWQYRIMGPKKLWNLFGLSLALFKDRKNFDLVFSPGHYAPPFVFGKKLVISIMDLGFLKYPQHFKKLTFLKLKLWTFFSVKKADHIFAISNSTKNDIIDYYQEKPSKITVTYLGFDRERFNEDISFKKRERVKAKYKTGENYVLYLGTLKPSKNIEGLVRAFAKIKNKTKSNLVIAGKKGWLFESIEKTVKDLGLEKRVVFIGFVEEDDVAGLISAAQVFSLVSFWEGFGIPAVQAMACRVPVLVSNRGSLPEVVCDAGEIVDPENLEDIAEKILKLLSDKKYRDEKIKKGLLQAQKFSWKNCAKQTIATLEKIGKGGENAF